MLKARLATEIGTRVYLRRYWGDKAHGSKYGIHNAMKLMQEIEHPILVDPDATYPHLGGEPNEYPDHIWPTQCEECGELVPENATRQVFNKRWYDTPSGDLEPGDIFWITWYPKTMYWDNHEGPYLAAVLPNGDHWVIDSRASNCGLPEDRLHRCWVRHGVPPEIHVDKEGLTCSAGAGSVATPGKQGWHGFLHNGNFHV